MGWVGAGLLIVGFLIIVAALSSVGDTWGLFYTGLAIAAVGGFIVHGRSRSRSRR